MKHGHSTKSNSLKKIGINHSSFEVNQTLNSVNKQSGTHTRKIGIEQNQTF